MDQLTVALKAKAQALGFSFVGIVAARPSRQLAAYKAWISAEMHGEMGYLARPDRLIRREDPAVILPEVASIICVGLDYFTNPVPAYIANDPNRGRISNYAWGADYHTVMTPRLKELAAWLQAEAGAQTRSKVYVDTGAILERSHAEDAGLGFVGKNTMLINPRHGSYLFLGELLTTQSLTPDPIQTTMPGCGSCTRCLTDCPTDAFPAPFVLDARRCISYLTIELKGWIPAALRPLMGNWIYGCDICQTVCPWNRFAKATNEVLFSAETPDMQAPLLADILTLDQAQFDEHFANSPIKRIKRNRLVRNACIAAGNSKNQAFQPILEDLLYDDDRIVRGTAAWAIGRIGIIDSRAIEASLVSEHDAEVRAEKLSALQGLAQA